MGTQPPTSWHAAIDDYLMWLRAADYSPGTVSLRRSHLMKMSRDLSATDITTVTTAALIAWQATPAWQANTRRSYRSTARDFFAWAEATGLLAKSPAAQLPRVRMPRAQPRPAPEEVVHEALRAVTEREWRAVLLAAQCGLRVSEVSRVHRRDVQAAGAHWRLRVVGKGRHVRMVPLPDDLARSLLELDDGWAFPSSRGSGRHLTAAYLGKVISRTLSGSYTTHTLRHRAGTVAYERTRDIRAVQELLGHARLDTTQIYTKISDDSVRAAMDAAAPPTLIRPPSANAQSLAA